MIKKNSDPGDGQEPGDAHQLELFQHPIEMPGNIEIRADEDNDPDDEVIIARDPLFTYDVPLANDEHVREIPMTVVDRDGLRREVTKVGKVLYRVGPHPDWVLASGEVMRREKAVELGVKYEALMLPFITTITYDNGVVQHMHIDAFHALTSELTTVYANTGKADGQVVITKERIAEILKVEHNGRLGKIVEEALETLSGIRVVKTYPAPAEGQPGHGIIPTVTKQMGAWIVNKTIERYSGLASSKGGRKPDRIIVDLNQAFARAMTGDRSERSYLTRGFNLRQRLRYQIAWKKQLMGVIEGRLDVAGRFQIPMDELWVDVLGLSASDLDPAHPERRRKVRWKLLQALREREATGYLVNARIVQRKRGGTSEMQVAAGDTVIKVDDGKTEMTVPGRRMNASTQSDMVDWVECDEGPTFLMNRPMMRPAFARKILNATCVNGKMQEEMLKDFGLDAILDIGYRRLKHFCNLVGDRVRRLPIEAWLSENYPKAQRMEIVRGLVKDHNYRVNQRALGRGADEDVPAEHDARRQRVIRAHLNRHAVDLDFKIYVNQDVEPKGDVGAEVVQCFRLALRQLMHEGQMSENVLSEEHRIVDPKLARQFDELVARAGDIGTQAAGMVLWFRKVEKRCEERLPALGEKWPDDLRRMVATKFPEVWGLMLELTSAGRKPWEQHMGRIYQQRVGERYVEGELLREFDPAGEPTPKASADRRKSRG